MRRRRRRRALPLCPPRHTCEVPSGATGEVLEVGRLSPLDVEEDSAAISLSWPERWEFLRDEANDTYLRIDVFGPDRQAGQVVACIRAEQARLLPEVIDGGFSLACAHLVAREARSAYDAGLLDLVRPFVPAVHSIAVDVGEVEDLLRSGAELPQLGDFDDKIELGDIEVSDEYRAWPLTFYGLEDNPDGGATLTLEVDAENGPILTFEVTVTRTQLDSRYPAPATTTSDPFWRGVAAVAIDEIRKGIGDGSIPVPDGVRVELKVTLDLIEAARISQDPVSLARLVRGNPKSWPA